MRYICISHMMLAACSNATCRNVGGQSKWIQKCNTGALHLDPSDWPSLGVLPFKWADYSAPQPHPHQCHHKFSMLHNAMPVKVNHTEMATRLFRARNVSAEATLWYLFVQNPIPETSGIRDECPCWFSNKGLHVGMLQCTLWTWTLALGTAHRYLQNKTFECNL